MSKKKILFISHEASLTGAPILLVNLLKLVKKYNEYNIDILCIKKGPLNTKFESIGRTHYLKPENYNEKDNSIKGIFTKIKIVVRLILSIPVWLRADVIFNNTCVNGKFLKFYSMFRRKRIISYIHEMETLIRSSETIFNYALTTTKLSDVIVSPNSLNENVIKAIFKNWINNNAILRYHIPRQTISNDNSARNTFLKKINVPQSALLVLGIGTFDHRKGADYFVNTAAELKNENIHFFWIGAKNDDEFSQKIDQLVQSSGISNFHYLGKFPHNLENYAPFDLLFLSSREDPYPLVVLEAAQMSIPAICFSKSGGIVEFIDKDCGWRIENFSAQEAASVIQNIDRNEIKMKGEAARLKVEKWHLDSEVIYNEFKKIIAPI